jgi:hypothetical protein
LGYLPGGLGVTLLPHSASNDLGAGALARCGAAADGFPADIEFQLSKSDHSQIDQGRFAGGSTKKDGIS